MDNKLRITLKACRINCGLTRNEVAIKLGKTERTIINWESGESLPDDGNLNLLSKIYNIPKDYIFLGNKFTLSERYNLFKKE